MHPVELRGERIRLREFRADDEAATFHIVGDDRVTRWLSFDSRDRQQTRALLARTIERARQRPRDEYYLAVTPAGSDQVVGFASLSLSRANAARIGYAIHADHWGNRYATDASRAVIDFGFRELDLHRISAATGPDNNASIAVVDKLGFTYEGRLRDHVFTNGAWRDSLLYSILRHEWAE